MKRAFRRNLRAWVLAALTVLSSTAFVGCNDEIDMENRYTFKGELISTYLENNPQKFSKFTYILERAKIGKEASKSGSVLKTLSTYGSYTCFAPTDTAVATFLKTQYEKYLEGEDTGITSPYLEDLTDEAALEIAKNHIIEMGYMTTEINDGAFPTSTMNRRVTTIETITDEQGRVFPLLNNSARIIEQDLEKENGYIQVIDGVLNPSSYNTNELLGNHSSFSLFYEALEATGLSKDLEVYEIDPDYDNTKRDKQFSNKPGYPRYPEEHKQRFTLLVESNDLLADPNKNHLGWTIDSFDKLVAFAEQWYGEEQKGNYTHPDNALYKFVAYHIIDRQLLYSSSTGPGGFIMENYVHMDFNSEENLPSAFDRYDYFETKLPYTMIKVTKPFTNNTKYTPYGGTENESALRQEIIINYAQEDGTRCKNPNMSYHLNVVVERASVTKRRPGLEDFDQSAINGIIHTIDRILIYNEDEMVGNVLNERMRWDSSSIFPELTNNGVRWFPQSSEDGKAGELIYIPNDFSTRLKVNNEDTNVFYLRPHKTSTTDYSTYMGDEVVVSGKYDFSYRIPHVPTGNYEIRFGFNQSDARGVCQFYLDNKICGIPVDMGEHEANQILIGWFDEEGLSEEEIRENDKAMRNRGWMKGPASCHLTKDKESMRKSKKAIRRIIGTFRLDQGDHWLRFKDVTESLPGKFNEFSQDYLEIVPTSIITDGTKPEDRN